MTETETMAPVSMPETRPLYWSVRRELWENRFLYIAPLLVNAVVLFASFITMIVMASKGRLPKGPISMAPAPIMFTTLIVGFFYSLDALYGERRDRSILFWKSLPISDFTTVVSKASIPLVVLPSLAFVLSVATQVVMIVLGTPVLLVNGLSPLALLADLHFFEGLLIMIYGLTVHALWYAPVYGWFMLISAAVRRAPFLWAILPLLAVAAVERILFNSWYLMTMLGYRMAGAMREAFSWSQKSSQHADIERLSQLTAGRFLSAPALWVGLAFAAACFAAAVRLRRNREPI